MSASVGSLFRVGIACFGACLPIMLTGCSKPASDASGAVSGSINFPADPEAETALLEVLLKDTSATGGENLIAVQRIRKHGPAPVRYALPYEQQRIDATHRYVIEAKLILPDRLLYSSEAHAVITFGNSTRQDLKMMPGGNPVDSANTPTERTINATLATDSGKAEYVAYLNGSHITRIEEQRHARDGDVRAIYTFRDARLISAEEKSAAGQPMVSATFGATGQLEAISAWQNGKSIQPGAGEAGRLRNHAELLRNHALASGAAQQHRGTY